MSFVPTTRPASSSCEPLERRTLLAAQLVADLNPTTLGSGPQPLTTLGDAAYFFARGTDGTLGFWQTDGTPANTRAIKTGMPFGRPGVIDYPAWLTASGDRLYFSYRSPEYGWELWTSDGTAAGTRLVIDLLTGPAPGGPAESQPTNITPVGNPAAGRVVFAATGPDGVRGLWVSDGTSDGTSLLRSFYNGLPDALNAPSYPFVRYGNDVVFAASDVDGPALWKTDGTPQGTVRLAPLVNALSAAIGDPTVAGGVLYFTAPSPQYRGYFTLWRSDGTPEGTRPVDDTAAAPLLVSGLIESSGKLWFTAADAFGSPASGLWRSDGTAAGTRRVVSLPPGSSAPYDLVASGMEHFFFVTNSGGATTAWWSDGTQNGTSTLDTLPAAQYSGAFKAVAIGGDVYFSASNPQSGWEVWKTDGTTAGTAPLEVQPGPVSALPWGMGDVTRVAAVGGRLVFAAAAVPDDFEPWATDGTPAGTRQLADINLAPQGSDFRPIIPLGDGAIFSANGRLYHTGGTPDTTVKLADVNVVREILPEGSPPVPHASATVNGVAVFAAASPDNTVRRVYRSDGTPEGTYPLGNLDPIARPSTNIAFWPRSAAAPFVTAGGFVYFFADDGVHGLELWKSDGTVAGTSLVIDIVNGAGSWVVTGNNPPALAAVGDTVFFKLAYGELWKTDGTAAGTVKVTDLGGFDGNWLYGFHGLGDRLLFVGGFEGLMSSDGTAGGTGVVARVRPVSDAVVLDGAAYFWAVTFDDGVLRLYRSDGTPQGTAPIPGVAPGPAEIRSRPLAVLGGAVYFTAADEATGAELWKTDGTPAGTARVADLRPGPDGARPHRFATLGGRLYFFADDGAHGRELWSTDGTAAGTTLADDLLTGPPPSGFNSETYFGPTSAGNQIFFVADDPRFGHELWRVAGSVGPARVVARHLFDNDSPADGHDPAANPADDNAVDAATRPLPPGEPASSANVGHFARGITGVMIDVTGLPPGNSLSPADFLLEVHQGAGWSAGPAPAQVAVRRGAGASGADRVTLTLPAGAVRNAWLRVTTLANARTGLAAPDVFSFGNLPGDTGNDRATLIVDARDLAVTLRNFGRPSAAALAASDFNRDGKVDAADVATVRQNLRHALPLFTAPAASVAKLVAFADTPIASRTARPPRRVILTAPEPGLPV